MPRYEHKCLNCEFLFEVTYGIKEEPVIKCIKCKSITKRQISKGVMFETPMDIEFEGDPSELSKKGLAKVARAKKTKFRW